MMTEFEIVNSYKFAKNKRNQLDVLAALNEKSKEEIKKILVKNNVEVIERKKPTQKTKPEEKVEVKQEEPVSRQSSIKDFLLEQMANAMEEQERARRDHIKYTKLVESLSILLSKC